MHSMNCDNFIVEVLRPLQPPGLFATSAGDRVLSTVESDHLAFTNPHHNCAPFWGGGSVCIGEHPISSPLGATSNHCCMRVSNHHLPIFVYGRVIDCVKFWLRAQRIDSRACTLKLRFRPGISLPQLCVLHKTHVHNLGFVCSRPQRGEPL